MIVKIQKIGRGVFVYVQEPETWGKLESCGRLGQALMMSGTGLVSAPRFGGAPSQLSDEEWKVQEIRY